MKRVLQQNDSTRANKFLIGRRIFSQISSKKIQKITPQKNVFPWFWAPFFSKQSTSSVVFLVFPGILRRFSHILSRFPRFLPEFCPDFHQVKTFGSALAPPAPPASHTTEQNCRLFNASEKFIKITKETNSIKQNHTGRDRVRFPSESYVTQDSSDPSPPSTTNLFDIAPEADRSSLKSGRTL